MRIIFRDRGVLSKKSYQVYFDEMPGTRCSVMPGSCGAVVPVRRVRRDLQPSVARGASQTRKTGEKKYYRRARACLSPAGCFVFHLLYCWCWCWCCCCFWNPHKCSHNREMHDLTNHQPWPVLLLLASNGARATAVS